MSSLIPQQRADKNGKVVTRHVRPEASASTGASIPAPSAPGTSDEDVSKRWRQLAANWHLDDDVRAVCAEYQKERSYVFDCTDNEAYEVMSNVSGANALPLLAAGVRTKKEALSFLIDNGLRKVVTDNAMVMKHARRRKLLPVHVMKFMREFETYKENKNFMDAMEASSMISLQTIDRNDPHYVTRRVLVGLVDLSDIKKVGPNRISNAASTGYPIVDALAEMKKGNLKYSAGEMRALLSIKEIHSVSSVMELADKYGISTTQRIARRCGNLPPYFMEKLVDKHGLEGFEEPSDYINVVIDLTGRVDPHGIEALYEAGVDKKDAIDGLNEGLTHHQIIAMGKEVDAPLAKGWL